MPFIITDPCIDTKDTACVDVCPVDCIHPRKDEAEYAQMSMLFIHPDECIDCGVCEPECPAEAIVPDSDESAAAWQDINKEYAEKWPNITAKGESPADADEWKGKPDKKQLLDPNPGSNA